MTTDNDKLDSLSRELQERRDGFDAATVSRLNQARQTALQQLDQPRTTLPGWVPAGVAASLILTVALVSFSTLQPGAIEVPQKAAPDLPNLDLMLAETELEMLEEMDFYLWLESKETSSRSPFPMDGIS